MCVDTDMSVESSLQFATAVVHCAHCPVFQRGAVHILQCAVCSVVLNGGGVTKNVPFVEFEGLIRATGDNTDGQDKDVEDDDKMIKTEHLITIAIQNMEFK